MAFVPVLLSEVQKRVAAILVAGPDDGSYALATTDQQHYAPQEITDAILEIDLEVCRKIVGSLKNGYRSQYIADSAELNFGDKIPFHPGKIGQPEVKVNGVYQPGILAPSLEAVARWAADPVLFPAIDCAGRYRITDKAFFIGQKIRVQLPMDLVIGATLQSPQSYTATVIRGTVAALPKDGLDPALFAKAAGEYERDGDLIIQGVESVPDLDL